MGLPKKISQLPNAGSLKNSDIFVLVNQHDITSQTTLGEIVSTISGSGYTNTFVTGGTYNSVTTSLDFNGNTGFIPFSVGVNPLLSPFDITGTDGAVQPKDSSYTNTTQGTVWLGGTVTKIMGDYNFIGNGVNHNIEMIADYSFIGNGNNNHLGDGVNQVAYSAILAGKDNTIEGTAFNSAIIAGENNTITHSNTFILGSNITSTQADTTYLNNVNISGDTKLSGDLDLCPNGTIHCDSFSGCSPIHFHAPVEFDNSITLSADEEVILDFENADDVLIPTYVLKDCNGIKSNIVTFQNFSEYVGQTVNLASEGDTKWEVSLQPTLEVTGVHECCIFNYTLTNCVSGEIYGIVNGSAWAGEEFL